MNEEQLIRAALDLLKRCDIKGGEVPVYVEINNWLQSKLQQSAPPTVEAVKDDG